MSRGGPCISLATRVTTMEKFKLNKSLCEGGDIWGELDVMEESELEKSKTRKLRDHMHAKHEKQMKLLKHLKGILLKMQDFSLTKKKYVPTHWEGGVQEALSALQELYFEIVPGDCELGHFEYYLRERMKEKIKELKAELGSKAFDRKFGGDSNQETRGEEAESLHRRGEVGGGCCQEEPPEKKNEERFQNTGEA